MIPLSAGPLRLLVTGGAGFIGSHLTERLVEAGHQVCVLDDGSTGCFGLLPPQAELVRGCVTDGRLMDGLRTRFDGVFHLAGIVGMRLAVGQQERAYRVATLGTERLLDAIDAPMVLFSSSAVYGIAGRGSGNEAIEVDEQLTLAYDAGQPGYALGKLHAEQIARRRIPGRILAIRPFNVVGLRQSGVYGMVLPSFLAQARAGEPLSVYDDGLQTRSFCDVSTFVDTVLRLAGCAAAWDQPIPAVNVGNDRETAVLELARLVIEASASSSPIRLRPYAEVFPGRTDLRSRRPDVVRLHRLVGRPAWRPVEQVVRELAGSLAAEPAAAVS